MISFPESAADLINDVKRTSEVSLKGHTAVWVGYIDADGVFCSDLQVELIYVKADGTVVGDEAEDYTPKDGEYAVVSVHRAYRPAVKDDPNPGA